MPSRVQAVSGARECTTACIKCSTMDDLMVLKVVLCKMRHSHTLRTWYVAANAAEAAATASAPPLLVVFRTQAFLQRMKHSIWTVCGWVIVWG